MDKKVILVLLAVSFLVLYGCGSTVGEAKGGKPGSGGCQSTEYECSDCLDNDGDGLADYKVNKRGVVTGDPDCESLADDYEGHCGDGRCKPGYETCSTCAQDCGTCPPICGDGQCNGVETCSSCSGDCGTCPNTCSDSDGGFNPFVKGTLSVTINHAPLTIPDVCNGTTTLMENYCLGSSPRTERFNCAINQSTCVNGACII